SLGTGESAAIVVTHQSGLEITGTYQIWSSADSWYQVSELDENDNDAGPISITVSVTGTPPSEVITGTGTIEGQTWIALSGFPVPHGRADVWCVNEAGDTVASTISGDDGGYTLSNLPAGTYTVLAETWIDGSRYAGSRNNVIVSDGGTGVAIVIMY
ncbi:MAG: carboxypeptidase-like regulatory domain-containing protein, partial [Chloroflexota bacterium]|nr:carboxypeptidase-like regulatory domain-containing protein [Chloroflexota bacterium]